jgi:hypothetical protein
MSKQRRFDYVEAKAEKWKCTAPLCGGQSPGEAGADDYVVRVALDYVDADDFVSRTARTPPVCFDVVEADRRILKSMKKIIINK